MKTTQKMKISSWSKTLSQSYHTGWGWGLYWPKLFLSISHGRTAQWIICWSKFWCNCWSVDLAFKLSIYLSNFWTVGLAFVFLISWLKFWSDFCQAQPSSIQRQLSWLGWDSFNFNFYPQGKYRAQLSPAQSNSNSVGWANRKQYKLEASLSWAWHSSFPACFVLESAVLKLERSSFWSQARCHHLKFKIPGLCSFLPYIM